MGFRWSEVQILSPRPEKTNSYDSKQEGFEPSFRLCPAFCPAQRHAAPRDNTSRTANRQVAATWLSAGPLAPIDSLSHGWQEFLQEVDRLASAKYRGNTWSAESEGTSKQRALVNAILAYPGHVIATMRSHTEWGIEANAKGGQKPVRIGLAPEQGKGIEYEFDLLLELSPQHLGLVLKDRNGRFQDAVIERPGEDFGQALAAWLTAPATETPASAEPKAAKRSRKTAGKDEPPAAEPGEPKDAPTTLPPEIVTPETPIAEAVQEQVERFVLRAAKAGARTQAHHGCRQRNTGVELD
jgi:hypothetical protein